MLDLNRLAGYTDLSEMFKTTWPVKYRKYHYREKLEYWVWNHTKQGQTLFTCTTSWFIYWRVCFLLKDLQRRISVIVYHHQVLAKMKHGVSENESSRPRNISISVDLKEMQWRTMEWALNSNVYYSCALTYLSCLT